MMLKITESEKCYVWINTFKDEIPSRGPGLPLQAFTNLQKQNVHGKNTHRQAKLFTDFCQQMLNDTTVIIYAIKLKTQISFKNKTKRYPKT